MRGVLVFAPHADPTYVPLGLATLSAHVSESAPDCDLVPVDLNLAWWERLADLDPAVGHLRSYLKGKTGKFYDPAAYGVHRKVWSRAAAHGQASHCVLVAHSARQAQRIAQRVLAIGIMPESGATGTGAEMGGMQGDNRGQT